MEYPEVNFEIDTAHLTVSHKPTGTIFQFDGYPDPIDGNEVRVSVPGSVDESELTGMCTAAGVHLKTRLFRTRS